MADIKALVLSFPPNDASNLSPKEYDKSIAEYIKTLERVPGSFWNEKTEKENVFTLLNPSTNTVPYLLALRHQLKTVERSSNRYAELLEIASIFFSSFDVRQARHVEDDFVAVLSWFFDGFRNAIDLSPLTAAMLRLDPTAGTFTIFHLHLVRLALSNAVPSEARAILDKDIYAFAQSPVKHIPQEHLGEEVELSNAFITAKSSLAEGIRSHHVLEYYLLGAIIYIGSRNFARARLFLEYVLLSPTHQHVVSALQIEAYKKWTLVGLLAQGKPYPLPRTIDQSLLRTVKTQSKAYEALAKAATDKNWRRFQAETDIGQDIWAEDGNHETIRQVGIALQQYMVLDLQKTFTALPVSRVAKHLSLTTADALSLVTVMTRNGTLHATIDESQNGGDDVVLRFLGSDPLSRKVDDEQNDLQSRTERIEGLVTYIQDADRRLQLTREYVDHVRRQKRAVQSPDGDLAEQMDLTWDAPAGSSNVDDGDEDIMAT